MQQGSRFCARQTKGSPHAREIPTPTPAVNLRFDIDCLAQGLEGTGSLSVGKDEKQPKQFPMDASGRGDDCRQEGVTHTWSRIALLIFITLLLYPLSEHESGCLTMFTTLLARD